MSTNTSDTAKQAISIRTLSIVMGIIAVLLSGACLVSIGQLSHAYRDYAEATERYFACQSAADEMSAASDFLTSEVRIYVATQAPQHLDHYFGEVNDTRRRDHAVEVLVTHLSDSSARTHLDQALASSNELMKIEMYAMKLVLVATGVTPPRSAAVLNGVTLTAQDEALSAQDKVDKALDLVFNSTYEHYDDSIEASVKLCRSDLLESMGDERARESAALDHALLRLELFIILIVVDFLITLVGFGVMVLKPLYSFVRRIRQSEPLDDAGSQELRYLSSTYNAMYEESRRAHERLKRKSELDSLTGIYNREVFNKLLRESGDKQIALLLVDVDNFKGVNDGYGHVVGDRVLQKVARLLDGTFRQSDFPCRIGGDEFAVLMMGVDATMEQVVADKIGHICAALLDTADGLPAITLSIGIAFGPVGPTSEADSLYNRADKALYQVKESGRNGYRFWQQDLG